MQPWERFRRIPSKTPNQWEKTDSVQGGFKNLVDRRKKISNVSEIATRRILEKAIPRESSVFEKLRVADALDIQNSGLNDEEYRYALAAHFDFVIADANKKAQFAVEFDGPRHISDTKTIRRDKLKDAICVKLGMPLLRVSSEFLQQKTGQFTLLDWIVELWFVQRGFWEAVKDGRLSSEADFCYWLTSTIRIVDEEVITYDYNLARPDDTFLRELHKKGHSKDYHPSIYRLMGDMNSNIVALGCFRIHNDAIIVGETRFRAFHFSPISVRELSADLVVMDVARKVRQYKVGKYPSRTKEWADRRVDTLRKLGERSGREIDHIGPADIYGSDNCWNSLSTEFKELI